MLFHSRVYALSFTGDISPVSRFPSTKNTQYPKSVIKIKHAQNCNKLKIRY